MSERSKTRPASAAGLFYPANNLDLERDISLFLENAPVLSFPRPILGMIVPDAHYSHCGGVSGRAYRQIIAADYDVIVVIAASSKEQFDYASIYPGHAFETPGGTVLIDRPLVAKLAALNRNFMVSAAGYSSEEYGLEVQLPFIQRVQPRVKILPLVLGSQSSDLVQSLHNTLIDALRGQKLLMIASSILSGSYSDEKARSVDNVAIEDIRQFSPYLLYRDIKNKACEMNAYGAVLLTMKVVKEFGAQNAEILLYRNSGEITGDRRRVEGYLSGVFY